MKHRGTEDKIKINRASVTHGTTEKLSNIYEFGVLEGKKICGERGQKNICNGLNMVQI